MGNWEATDQDLAAVIEEIKAVQLKYPKKEDREQLEEAIKPLRSRCVAIHNRRIKLNTDALRKTREPSEKTSLSFLRNAARKTSDTEIILIFSDNSQREVGIENLI